METYSNNTLHNNKLSSWLKTLDQYTWKIRVHIIYTAEKFALKSKGEIHLKNRKGEMGQKLRVRLFQVKVFGIIFLTNFLNTIFKIFLPKIYQNLNSLKAWCITQLLAMKKFEKVPHFQSYSKMFSILYFYMRVAPMDRSRKLYIPLQSKGSKIKFNFIYLPWKRPFYLIPIH